MKFKGNKTVIPLDKILTKKYLIKEYIKNNKSTIDIANKIGCSSSSVVRKLHKNKIKIPTYVEKRKGKLGNRYKKGKYTCVHGYKWLLKKTRDYKDNGISRYVREHRYLIEQKIGRKLKKEEKIHHVDMDKTNNKLSNLYLCKNQSQHSKIHRQLERIAGELVKLKILKFNNGEYKINRRILCQKIKNQKKK